MPKKVDIKPGDKFGHWTVLSSGHHLTGKRDRYCYCVCECGAAEFIPVYALTSGHSKSCGCSRGEKREHHATGCSQTRLGRIWRGMVVRCYYADSPPYKYYGARGITICDEWRNDFKAFESWALSHGYTDELTIERVDNNKGYSPDNCIWATFMEQGNNRRNNVLLTHDGRTQTLSQWAHEIGMNVYTLYTRVVKRRWDIERALTEPIDTSCHHKSAV